MIFQSVTRAAQKCTLNRRRTYDRLVTSPDALPLKATVDWWELRPLKLAGSRTLWKSKREL